MMSIILETNIYIILILDLRNWYGTLNRDESNGATSQSKVLINRQNTLLWGPTIRETS